MRRYFLAALILAIITTTASTAGKQSITSLLPDSEETGGWTPADSVQVVKGDDLFMLINGGAEIYHEFGFEEAVTEVYKKGERTINLEIYRMKSPAAAFGMYSNKTGGGSGDDNYKELAIGNGALLEDYYLNTWKGPYVVTLTGFDNEAETLAGLQTLAGVITRKIKNPGQHPEIIKLLLKEELQQTGIKYLKGNLSLFNQYEFAAEDIFGIEEGVIGSYPGYLVFIFKYNERKACSDRFKNAAAYLGKSERFKNFKCGPQELAFSATDKLDRHVYARCFKNYIFIILGKSSIEAEHLIQQMIKSSKIR